MVIAARASSPSIWLALAGPVATELQALLPEIDVRVVDSAGLRRQLSLARPRLVLLAQPPATAGDLEAVLNERLRPMGSLRTVLLTVPDDLPGRLTAFEQGFDDALPVSIDARELAARLRRLALSVPVPTRREAIEIGAGLVLDLEAYELRKGGQHQPLRPKELQLLALFATHPRRAFSRHELLTRVWGAGFHGDPRTIDVHVRWLRSKVELHPERPAHLVTVRGLGYRFDPPA